jgi:hypothetical protein
MSSEERETCECGRNKSFALKTAPLIPSKADFFVGSIRLTDGTAADHAKATLSNYVVTPQLAGCFDQALKLVQGALTSNSSKAAYRLGDSDRWGCGAAYPNPDKLGSRLHWKSTKTLALLSFPPRGMQLNTSPAAASIATSSVKRHPPDGRRFSNPSGRLVCSHWVLF